MIADDYQEIKLDDGKWGLTWYPPEDIPNGENHGSAGVCFNREGNICLIRIKGVSYWEFPAGRPANGESNSETLKREVLEEACSEILDFQLIGHLKTRQPDGKSRIRSFYKTNIKVLPWEQLHEIEERKFCKASEISGLVSENFRPLVLKALVESGIQKEELI